jgi:CheY-like chemotaxis protein
MAKKILIVDDEETLIQVMRMCLETNGYEVLTADDGESGLAVWKDKQPDLILLDCIMPNMDGATFLMEAQQREDLAPVPIVMLSAKDDACVSLKADNVVARLSKPCGYDDLLETIQQHI